MLRNKLLVILIIVIFITIISFAQHGGPYPPPAGGGGGGAANAVTSSNSIYAGQIFVDAISGNDANTGSINDPYASITAGYAAATNGQTVVVLRGTFIDNQVAYTNNPLYPTAPIYVNEGVVVTNPNIFFMVVRGFQNTNVTPISGMGDFGGAFISIAGTTNFTMTVKMRNFSTTASGGAIQYQLVSGGTTGGQNNWGVTNFFFCETFVNSSAPIVNPGSAATNLYTYVYAAKFIRCGMPMSTTALLTAGFPYNDAIVEIDSPHVTFTHGFASNWNMNTKVILDDCIFNDSHPASTGNTNFFLYNRNVEFFTGIPINAASNSMVGTWIVP